MKIKVNYQPSSAVAVWYQGMQRRTAYPELQLTRHISVWEWEEVIEV